MPHVILDDYSLVEGTAHSCTPFGPLSLSRCGGHSVTLDEAGIVPAAALRDAELAIAPRIPFYWGGFVLVEGAADSVDGNVSHRNAVIR